MFYVHLSSDQDFSLHPNNTDVDFVIDLRSPLQLSGSWEVALVAYKGPIRKKDYFVCCDITQLSPVGTLAYPLLRVIFEEHPTTYIGGVTLTSGFTDTSNKSKIQPLTLTSSCDEMVYEFVHPQYVPLSRNRIERLCLSLIGLDGSILTPIIDAKTSFTLHFRPCV